MKKVSVYLMVMIFSLGSFNTVNATVENSAPAPTVIPVEIEVMLNRLEEIKSMDKSELTRSDRKALRVEVRALKTEIRSSGNGLYISAGAIIIILLLILIL
jgi:hypothetical protein